MAIQYPGALATSTQLPNRAGTDATAGNHAADHTQLAGEVIAIEAELGITPSGNYADVVTRLDSGYGGAAIDLYAAMNSLAGLSGTSGFPIAFTIPPESADTELGPTNDDLRGAAFMVKKTMTTVAMGFNVTAVAIGTGSNYVGGALFSMNASGDWVFIANTGATQGSAFVNATGGVGWKTMNWRNSGDTANQSQTLNQGTVYVVALCVGSWTTSTPKIMGQQSAASASNTPMNFGSGAGGLFRSGNHQVQTTKVTANIVQTNLNPVAFIPLLTLY